jgi:hypothetical protein
MNAKILLRLFVAFVGVILTPILCHGQKEGTGSDYRVGDYHQLAPLLHGRNNAGSTRLQAMGGAGSAMGGDQNAAFLNPAGLGVKGSSILDLSLLLPVLTSRSAAIGDEKESYSISGVQAPQFSYFQQFGEKDTGGGIWRSGIAISFTRINQPCQSFSYSGKYSGPSRIDQFTAISDPSMLDGIFSDDPTIGNVNSLQSLAYYTFLTDFNYSSNQFVNTWSYDTVYYKEEVKTTGGTYQWDFAYGASIKDRLYIGASLVLQRYRINSEHVYTENFGPAKDNITEMELNDNQEITGNQTTVNLGLIYAISQNLKAGLSVQLPGTIKLTQQYDYEITARFDDVEALDPNGFPTGAVLTYLNFDTKRKTQSIRYSQAARPRIGLSWAKDRLTINGDLEYIAYGASSIAVTGAPDGYDEKQEALLSQNYRGAFNFYGGAELRLDRHHLRSGISYFQDPSKKDNINQSGNRFNFSLGAGLRNDRRYLDAGVNLLFGGGTYRPFETNNAAGPAVKSSYFGFQLGIGAGLLF